MDAEHPSRIRSLDDVAYPQGDALTPTQSRQPQKQCHVGDGHIYSDAFLLTEGQPPRALELELSSKDEFQYRRIVQAYDRAVTAGTISGVTYLLCAAFGNTHNNLITSGLTRALRTAGVNTAPVISYLTEDIWLPRSVEMGWKGPTKKRAPGSGIKIHSVRQGPRIKKSKPETTEDSE